MTDMSHKEQQKPLLEQLGDNIKKLQEELTLYKQFAADVHWEDSGLEIWSDVVYRDILALAEKDNSTR